MSNVTEKMADTGYVADDADVRALVRLVLAGDEADGCYLKGLLVACQSKLGPVRVARGRAPAAPSPSAVIEVLNTIHNHWYGVALAEILELAKPEDIGRVEAHRRATKFRTAKATLEKVINSGVDLRALSAAKITKAALRRMATAPPGRGGPTKPEVETLVRSAQRGERMVLNALKGLAELDMDAAIAIAERLVSEVDSIVPVADPQPPPQHDETIVGVRRSQYSPGATPLLHRGAS